MNVSALIELLQKLPKDLIVVTEGYENGYDSIKEIKVLNISPNPDSNWWNGEYIKNESLLGTDAVYLYARKN